MNAEDFMEEMLNRINIDTGCFNTGKLSCLVIDEDKIDILNS